MSDTLMIAIIGAIQAVLLVVIPLWFRRRSDRNRTEDRADRAEVAAKVEGTQTTLNEIHTATNSNYKAMQEALKVATEKIEQLTKLHASKPPTGVDE